MEVVFDVSPDSYCEYTVRVLRKNPSFRVMYVALWVGIPVASGIGAAVLAQLDHLWAWIVSAVLVLFGLVYAVAHPLWYWGQLEQWVRAGIRKENTRGWIGRSTLVMTDESLTVITAVTRTEAKWGDVLQVESDDDFTVIRLTSVTAVILPRRGCRWDGDYERARDFALERFRATRLNPAPG